MSGVKTQKTVTERGRRLRVAGLVMAGVMVWSALIPLFGALLEARIYNLSPRARQVVGKPNSNLSAKFSYNTEKKTWQFNREGMALKADMIAEQQGNDDPSGVANALAQMQQQVGGSGKEDNSLYSVNLPEDGSKAVTYYDNNTQQSFKMTPKFELRDGKLKDGQLVYPLYGGGQLVYTAKTNGLKEDIVLERSLGDSLDFSYDLNMPKTLEARIMEDGSVGVFSADITLYGNISASSDMDQAKLDSARETAPKDHLLFALPAPVIKDAKGVEKPGKFSLNDNILTVHATGLNELTYPLSVDPSVVVTSSSDFLSGGNNEGDIDYTTADQITGMKPSGGTLGAWGTTTAVGSATQGTGNHGMGTVVYNGYMYVLGGATTEFGNIGDTAYAPINSNGTLGTWTAGTSLDTTGAGHGYGLAVVAYNGYIYAMGGQFSSQVVHYATLNPSTGAIGAWQTTTSLPAARFAAGSAVYNGYVYLVGGYGGGTLSSVIYSKINADGTLGSWQSTTAMTDTRATLGVFAYNNHLYAVGGYRDENNAQYSATLYSKINSDGTIGSWMTTTSVSQAGAGLGVTVSGGYAYAFGGSTGPSPGYAYGTTRAEYAQINANGTLGTWRSLTALSTATTNTAAVSYKGYIYVVAGRNQTSTPVSHDLVQYASVNPAGATTSWTTSGSNMTTSRAGPAACTYNGYIYAIGSSAVATTVEYAAITVTTGSVGTWATTTALPVALNTGGCTVYNGRIYVVGDDSGSTRRSYYATVSSTGTIGSWTAGTTPANNSWNTHLFAYTLGDGTATYLMALGTTSDSNGAVSIQKATINATTGALGSWTSGTTTSANTHLGGTAAVVGKYMYLLGGGDTATVDYATVNADSTNTAWATTTSLPDGTKFTDATVVNGCIYVVGGEEDASTLSSDVFYACPNNNGTITSWNTAPSLSAASNRMGVTSFSGYLFGVGGNVAGPATTNTVRYAKVNNGGSGSSINAAWQVDGDIAAVDNRHRHATVVYNGYVYMIGGAENGVGDITTETIEYAPINADGTLGSWVADTSHELPTARIFPGAVAYNGYMYVLGGRQGSAGAYLKSVLYAPISSTGALSASWASAGGNTTNGGQGAGVTAYNGYLYSLGGYDGVDYNTVQYAAINSNGTIGAWTTNANNFTTARSNLSAFAYNGYMYMAGGEGASLMNDIQYAVINSNGSLGTWSYAGRFEGARKDFTITAYNGFIYVTGGNDSTDSRADVQYAPLLSNGLPGSWQRMFAPINGDPVGARSPSGQAIWNGRLYAAGGGMLNGSSSTTMSGAKYLNLDGIARVARYSKLITLPATTAAVTINYNGSTNPGGTTVRFATSGLTGTFGSITNGTAGTGTDPGGSCSTASLGTIVWVQAIIDDSLRASFMGGTASDVTEIIAYYTMNARPTPQLRLHGGKWFSSEVQQPLDTCGA